MHTLQLFILPVFLLIVSKFGQQGYIERSVITALPFFFIIIAAGALAFKNITIKYVCITTILVVSSATVTFYFNRQDVWTVYKPNPDWWSAEKYLTDEISAAPSMSEIFTLTAADGLTYYNPHYKIVDHRKPDFNPPNYELQDNFWVINEIKKQTLPKIYDKILLDKKQTFYLIHNKYWAVDIKDIFEQLKADPRFEYKTLQSVKGLDIYRFELAIK